jgi:SAM-dependent methyltransferase
VSLPFRAAFDVAVCLYTSIGYGSDLSEEAEIFRSLRSTLRPGGRLVVETLHSGAGCRDAIGTAFLADGTLVLKRHRISSEYRLFANYTAIRPGGQIEEFTVATFCFSSALLCQFFRAAGFCDVTVHQGFADPPEPAGSGALSPLTNSSSRICVSGVA